MQHAPLDKPAFGPNPHERPLGPPAGETPGASPRHVPKPRPRRATDRDVRARAQPLPVRLHQRGRLPVHGVCEGRRPEDVQEQVQLPAARVPVPRGAPAQGFPVSRLPEGVLAARQDEEPHEDGARLLHAQGLRVPRRVLHAAEDGDARRHTRRNARRRHALIARHALDRGSFLLSVPR